MSVFSFPFLAFACLVVLAVQGARTPARRRAVLTIANGVFLAGWLPSWTAAAVLAALMAAGWLGLRVVAARPTRAVAALGIGAALVALLVLKRYALVTWLLPAALTRHPVAIVGISYLTFKYIHLLVDRYQGQLEAIDPLAFANYQLGFISLVAGPIQRYNDFAAWWRGMPGPADQAAALRSWRRVLLGLLLMGVLGALAHLLDQSGRERIAAATSRAEALGGFLRVFYAYPAYVYCNFAGYCDVVIGMAGVLGLTHQENFDRPWRARNLLEFWNRWHVSLTLWIRDYLFTPLYRALATRWPARSAGLGYGALFVALLATGVWHGATWNFVVFGAMHGAGVAAVRMYGDALKARLGRPGLMRYLADPAAAFAATLLTIHYVCASFLFFPPGLRATLDLLRRTGALLAGGS